MFSHSKNTKSLKTLEEIQANSQDLLDSLKKEFKAFPSYNKEGDLLQWHSKPSFQIDNPVLVKGNKVYILAADNDEPTKKGLHGSVKKVVAMINLDENKIEDPELLVKIMKQDNANPNPKMKGYASKEAVVNKKIEPYNSAIPTMPIMNEDTYYILIKNQGEQNLVEYLTSHQLTFLEKLKLCLAITNAVYSFHSHHYIHNDIKPENIVIYKDEIGEYHANLVDFQFSRHFDEEYSFNSGTALYAAPEKLFSRTVNTIESDYFALGVILCQILTEIDFPGKPYTEFLISKSNRNEFEKISNCWVNYLNLKDGKTAQIQDQTLTEESLAKSLTESCLNVSNFYAQFWQILKQILNRDSKESNQLCAILKPLVSNNPLERDLLKFKDDLEKFIAQVTPSESKKVTPNKMGISYMLTDTLFSPPPVESDEVRAPKKIKTEDEGPNPHPSF